MKTLTLHEHVGLSRKALQDLMELKDAPSLTIYFSSSPVRGFGDEEKNEILFKNMLSDLDSQLAKQETDSFPLTRSYLQSLRTQSDFWKRSGKTMVWLAREGDSPELRQIELAYSVEDTIEIGDRFYLRPLMREWDWQQTFWILQLDQANCRLFQADGHGVVETPWPDGVPNSIEDIPSSGSDASLQAHSTQTGHVVHHGHADKNHEKTVAERLFSDVGSGLEKIFGADCDPIVLAGDHRVVSMYRDTQPAHLDRVVGAVEGAKHDAKELHKAAWPMIQTHREKEIQKDLDRFSESQGGSLLQREPEKIVEAAARGQVETVYYRPGSTVPGSLTTSSLRAETDSSSESDLVDLAISLCIQHGGDVVALPKDFGSEPVDGVEMVAGLRYA